MSDQKDPSFPPWAVKSEPVQAKLERRLEERDNALVKISLALGGSDEWTDEATMLANVVRLAEEAKRPPAGMQAKQEPGLKYDAGKPRWDLWDLPFLEEVHAVLVFGEKKYGAWNWAKGMSWSRCFNAALRHLWAWWWHGEEHDPESGLSHFAHATCMIMFLHGMLRRRAGADDRPCTAFLHKEKAFDDPAGGLQRGKGHAPK